MINNSLVYISEEPVIAPLCGLCEGNSGMALIFMELSRFYKSPELLQIAKKLMKYEDKLWDSKTNNWPDFRKKINSLEAYQDHKAKFLDKEYSYFTKPGDSIGLKYGTMGIALVRLKAYEYTGDKKYYKSFKGALQKVNQVLQHHSHQLSALEIKLLDFLNHYQTIGFPAIFQEVLPLGEANKQEEDAIFGSQLKFPYLITIRIAEKLNLNMIKAFSLACQSDEYKNATTLKAFYSFFKDYLKNNKISASSQLKDILRLEYKKIKLQKSVKNSALLHVADAINIEKRAVILNRNEDELLKTRLVLNKNIVLLETKWRWVVDEIELYLDQFDPAENLLKPAAVYYVLLMATSQYNTHRKTCIRETSLSEYQYIILDLFEYPVTVAEVLEEFSTLFEINSAAESQSVKNIFLEIVKDGVFDRFLIAA
jgi:hypothetical protein